MPALATQPLIETTPPLKVWNSLVKKCLPHAENKDVQFWWNLTGYHLAVMIDAAGYSIEKQYEVLLFHYHWIVSNFGTFDMSLHDSGKLMLTRLQGTPIGTGTKA